MRVWNGFALSGLLMALMVLVAGCASEEAGFFGIRGDDDFISVKARLAEQGFCFESREGAPFIFTSQDFDEYYDFYPRTKLLAGLQQRFAVLAAGQDGYEVFEALYLNSYIFRDDNGGEVGVGFSALTGKPLYVYYYAEDIGPVLADCRARLGDAEQVFPAPLQGEGVSHHYFEGGHVLVILEIFAAGESGGGICCFADNVAGFYQGMRRELDKRGE